MDTGKCCDCGAETCLFVNGVPICVVCDARREKAAATPERPLSRPAQEKKPLSPPSKVSFAAA
jgi:hypothetical protein